MSLKVYNTYGDLLLYIVGLILTDKDIAITKINFVTHVYLCNHMTKNCIIM